MNRRSIPAAAATTVFYDEKQALTEAAQSHGRKHSETHLPRLYEADFSRTMVCVQTNKVLDGREFTTTDRVGRNWFLERDPRGRVFGASNPKVSSQSCATAKPELRTPLLQTLELPEEAAGVCDD